MKQACTGALFFNPHSFRNIEGPFLFPSKKELKIEKLNLPYRDQTQERRLYRYAIATGYFEIPPGKTNLLWQPPVHDAPLEWRTNKAGDYTFFV